MERSEAAEDDQRSTVKSSRKKAGIFNKKRDTSMASSERRSTVTGAGMLVQSIKSRKEVKKEK